MATSTTNNLQRTFRREAWYCPVCNERGSVRVGTFTRIGEIMMIGNCQFTRNCRGRMKRDTSGVLDGSGAVVLNRVPSVWTVDIPVGTVGQSITFDDRVFFDRNEGVRDLDDYVFDLFLNVNTSTTEGSEQKIGDFDVVWNEEEGTVSLTLGGGTGQTLAPGGTIVVSVNGDRERNIVETTETLAEKTTDERPLTVAGGALAVAIRGDLTGTQTIVVDYQTGGGVDGTLSISGVQSAVSPVFVGTGIQYAVKEVARIFVQESPTSLEGYTVFVFDIQGTVLLTRGTTIERMTISGVLPEDAFVVLPLRGRSTIEVIDDIDREYCARLRDISGNVVADGVVLSGISSRSQYSVSRQQLGGSVKLITRTGTVDFPTDVVFA
jgi:hypothetical protein